MQIRRIRSISQSRADALVVGVLEGGEVPRNIRSLISQETLQARRFEGRLGEVAALSAREGSPVPWVVLTGLGSTADHEAVRQAAGYARRAVDWARTLATTLASIPIEGAAAATVEGFGLADYAFTEYRSQPASDETVLELVGRAPRPEVDRAQVVVDAVGMARDLVNRPAADKPPRALASGIAEEMPPGVEAEIWGPDRLREERLAGILAVGAGSHREPCLLQLRYRGGGPRLCLVGKGVTFDSGGLSLKNPDQMEAMKTDMAGGAAVAAATWAIARLGVPLDVTTYVPLAENMPGGGAQRPGDVIRYRNGKTVEVLNTDAEGRLILADALCLASEVEPELIVDVATLTGACKIALGEKIAGLFGRPDEAVERVRAAAEAAGERVWPMPLPADYRRLIDSDVADMKNTGGRFGGAITAAALLAEFVGEGIPWAHLDVAGPARSGQAEHYVPKGATGFGVRTLVELALGMV
ncbi:MAG: putative cytosol aminopeptidase [Acidimicrobiia bacterium]|nr:MAG: putative cytosol aminopeptidase [Acidimicrobiia bacterium]